MKEIVRASIEDCSQIERFRLVTRLGNAILSNGGEVFRAEQAMEYAARALRLEAFNAYVIANGIFSNVVIDGRFYSSRICYVPLAPTILCRVDALMICRERLRRVNAVLMRCGCALSRLNR